MGAEGVERRINWGFLRIFANCRTGHTPGKNAPATPVNKVHPK
jgi:hypothetical protein